MESTSRSGAWSLGLLTALSLLSACESDPRSEPQPDAALPPLIDRGDPLAASAWELYGLRVGARWTTLRSGGLLRWKEITACEEVVLPDADTGEPRLRLAYVRENRSPRGLTSVHYLVVDPLGVVRVRRDDIDSDDLQAYATYDTFSPRLFAGPYHEGDQREYGVRTYEFAGHGDAHRGTTDASILDTVLGEEAQTTFAGRFRSLSIHRAWSALRSHQILSHYVPGVGEIREVTVWDATPMTEIQIEELVDFTPGTIATPCDPLDASPPAVGADGCASPLLLCPQPWGAGAPGCTDPRDDPHNCGACGRGCSSGVCAGGACVDPACDVPCEGTTVCCPMAWEAEAPGCTSPGRDANNCGGCGIVCAVGLICIHGTCECTPGTADCGTGACLDVLRDPLNCGACGVACGGDTPTCDHGVCVASCLSVDLAICDDACVDLDWSVDHCGRCGHPCGKGDGTAACRAGRCVTCAEAGLTDCAGDCAELDWDADHCGTCDRTCASDETCAFGSCIPGDGTCDEPCEHRDEICCAGSCISPRGSDTNCGGCGVDRCTDGCEEACRDGICVATDCGGTDD